MSPMVVFIVGATASGKTAAALGLARHLPIEIVNADSRQVYRGMSIGTAKSTPDELASVPHHLIDISDPSEGFSLAQFLHLARGAIDDILSRGKFPVIVGGTGQYVWGLSEGWEAPRVPPNPEVRARLEREVVEVGLGALNARLAEVDPAAASIIDSRNTRRVIRALEVWEATGRPYSEQRRKSAPPFTPLLFGLGVRRPVLHQRIALRIEHMVANGWLEEVRALLEGGSTPDLSSFSSAGYREIAAHLSGESTLDEALSKARIATNRLARMQSTWFRRDDPRINWLPDVDSLTRAVLLALGVDTTVSAHMQTAPEKRGT